MLDAPLISNAPVGGVARAGPSTGVDEHCNGRRKLARVSERVEDRRYANGPIRIYVAGAVLEHHQTWGLTRRGELCRPVDPDVALRLRELMDR